MRKLKESLERQEEFIERALSDRKDGFMRCGEDGLPIVTGIQALPITASTVEFKKQLRARMPERQLLEAITNCHLLCNEVFGGAGTAC